MRLINFRIRLSFDHYHLRLYHQQISMAAKQVYFCYSSFTKIHYSKLLHNSSGLPYVKDRLLSCNNNNNNNNIIIIITIIIIIIIIIIMMMIIIIIIIIIIKNKKSVCSVDRLCQSVRLSTP